MKKFIKVLSLLLFVLAILPLIAAEPENFIPAKSPVVMRFAASRAINLPWLKEVAKNMTATGKNFRRNRKPVISYSPDSPEVFPVFWEV